MSSELRTLGTSEIEVTSVAMGCWPIAGMTSVDVNESDSRATLRAAYDSGIRFFDTAYCYGREGESERLIGSELCSRRDQIVIATKGGVHWDDSGARVIDGSPQRLVAQCDESLARLGTDHVELYYLHAPDPNVPLAESAEALNRIVSAGKAKSIGVSNVDVAQLAEIHQVCPVTAVQPHFNMLQREIEEDLIPWCQQRDIAVIVYWPLMKGLLAGKLRRNHVFAEGDGRAKYPMFQGQEWERNQDFLDDLRAIATESERTVTELVVNWTIHRPGITAALCGAKRPEQIFESAGAMGWSLSAEANAKIEAALKRRGAIVSRSAV